MGFQPRGGTTVNGFNPYQIENLYKLPSEKQIMHVYGEAINEDLASVPDGVSPHYAIAMAQKAGRISSRNMIYGDGDASSTMTLAKLMEALLTGSGDAEATGGLIVQLIATITGDGEISDADMKAFLLMVATLTGDGDITADISAEALLEAILSGSGGAEGTATGTGAMAANILSYGDLTPEGIRDTVWNAVASSYNTAGSMGEKVNDAGSASNPWTEVIESGFTAAEILRIIASVTAGDATGLNGPSATFKSLDGTKDRVKASVSNGSRDVTQLDVSS